MVKAFLQVQRIKLPVFGTCKGNVLKVFKGHQDKISSIAFSPNGKSIITGSWDNTARLWDLQGNIPQVYKGHEVGINSVAFSPDGKRILTGSDDRTARLWELKKDLKEFQKVNSYQELSVPQKIKYNIMEFNDVLKLNDEKSIKEAADYYYEEINSAGKDNKNECLNNAMNLYNKLVIKYKNAGYSIKRDSLALMQKELKQVLQK